jgi:hypothetical protein
VRGRAILCHNFKLICPVQFRSQKYSASLPPQITSTNRPSRPAQGRWPSSRTLGRDAVDAAASGAIAIAGRFSVSDHAARRTNGASTPPPKLRPAARGRLRDWWRLLRTAKPCGPGTRCWCQAGGGFLDPTGFRSTANLSATVTRRIRRRGEHVISRQNHCAGNAG